jgi:isoamylase
LSTERDRLLSLVRGDFEVARGHPLPLGAHVRRGGINFSVFSAHATAVTLVLFAPGGEESILEWPLDPRYNRTGDVWHVFIGGLDPGVEYALRAERAPNPRPAVHRFGRDQLLLEPSARAVAGAATWGDGSGAPGAMRPGGGAPFIRPRRARLVEEEFDWGYDQPINRHLADSVIYEMHVRGFTVHPSSGVAHPGSYLGVIEKIPYLKELGVTAVELLPVTEFEENDNEHVDPVTGEPLKNYWGYQPLAFFAPKAGYAASRERGAEVREFKQMVKALHAAGIEVILDMVFNHSGEGDERGPTLSFRGLDNATYYLIDPASGRYLDFTGCGNTLNCNHPVVPALPNPIFT